MSLILLLQAGLLFHAAEKETTTKKCVSLKHIKVYLILRIKRNRIILVWGSSIILSHSQNFVREVTVFNVLFLVKSVKHFSDEEVQSDR